MKNKFKNNKKSSLIITLSTLLTASAFIAPLIISNNNIQPSININYNKQAYSQEIFNSEKNNVAYNNLKTNFLNDLKNVTNSNFVAKNLSSKIEIPISFTTKYLGSGPGGDEGYGRNEKHLSTDIKLFSTIDFSNYNSSANPNVHFSINSNNSKSTFRGSMSPWKDNEIILNSFSIQNNAPNDFGFFKTSTGSKLKFDFKNTEISQRTGLVRYSSGGSQGRNWKKKWITKAFINPSFETILYPNFSNQIDLSKIFKIHLNKGNQYSNNGKAFVDAPKLIFELNKDFLVIIQELYGLHKVFNQLLEYKNKVNQYGDLIFAGNKNEWYNIIVHNIFNKTKTANDIKKDIENTFFNVKPSKLNSTLPIYDKMNEFNLSIPNVRLLNSKTFHELTNIVNYEYPYQVILNFFKNYKINVKYETPQSRNSNRPRINPIWDGNTFLPLTMEGQSDTNKSYIDILDMSFEKIGNLEMGAIKPKAIDVDYDTTYPNVVKDNDSIKYEALFRQTSKNYDDFYQDSSTLNSRAIEIPFGKYASEIIYPDNTFVDLAFVVPTINKYLYDRQGSKDLFSAVSPITTGLIPTGTSNWKEAYNEFKLIDKDSRINFTRNNYDGIFYAVGEINNWKFIDDNPNDELQGDFTKTFREKINANKDIIELKSIDSNQTNGFFLLRLKTNITTPNPNRNGVPIIDNSFDDSWNNNNNSNAAVDKSLIANDRANPLLKLNTKSIQDYIKSELNNTNNWIDENIVNETTFDKIAKTNKKLNLNKELSLSLPNGYEHLYVVDKELMDNPLDINTIKDPIQNSLAYLWSRSINFSNEKTNIGKIVSRTFDKFVSIQNPDWTSPDSYINVPTYIYSLNPEYQYQNTIIQDNRWITEGTLKIVNKSAIKNINSFNYKITIGELIDMFSMYKNAPDFQADYAKSSSNIANLLLNNSVEKKETKVGNIIGISVGILVGVATIAIISYIISKRKKQKKADYLLK